MQQSMMKSLSEDAILLFILAKIDQYKGEIEFFSNKYGKGFTEVEREAHAEKGSEDFELEEDLEDWEFATKSLEYWTGGYYKIKPHAAVA